ncbi:MAG: hypothetical protein HOP22_08865 [Nitrospiraceae bacterium]|nr:hypothetical protein [Nitrospiraceae bacterium]
MMRPTMNILVSLVLCLTAAPVFAESLSNQDRAEIDRLRAVQGHAVEAVNPLLEQVTRAGEKGFPIESLANKVKEGLAKGVEPKRIDAVLRQMVTHFDSAKELLQESTAKGVTDRGQGNSHRALESLAEAISRGATADEVRELARTGQHQGQKMSEDTLAMGAKSLAVMKEAHIPPKDGVAVVAEGMRHGFRPAELADLARDMKRHGQDFREGRITTQSIQDKISRGDRSDQLFSGRDHSGSGGGDRTDRSGGSDRGGRDDRSGGGGGNDSGGGRPDHGGGGGGHGGRDH